MTAAVQWSTPVFLVPAGVVGFLAWRSFHGAPRV